MKNLPNDYKGWATYLSKARNGNDRPLGSTKRVLWGGNGSIRLRLHWTDVVTLHPDGTETITTGGWQTVTTARFLSEHSRARVWSEKGQLYVRVRQPEVTPPRVRKCRMCTDGYRPRECYGPMTCYWQTWVLDPSTHDYVQGGCDREHDEHNRHLTCEHGQTARHALDPVACWQCQGEGRYDYGSREVHHAWHGESLTIDADGYAVPNSAAEVPAPQTYSAPPAASLAPSSYTDSGRLLTSALPGLRTAVACPHCDTAGGTLDAIIIHLNDSARWTREQVADWLDTLDVDLTFPTPDEIPAHIR